MLALVLLAILVLEKLAGSGLPSPMLTIFTLTTTS